MFIRLWFVLILFVGCSSQKIEIDVPIKKEPIWFKSPPMSTDITLYSVSEGINKQDAINHALNEILSTLSISIDSKFKTFSYSKVLNGIETYNEQRSSSLRTEVKKIRISNYKILHYEKIAFHKHIVLVSLNKLQLFNTIKDEVDKKIAYFKKQEISYKSTNLLKQLCFYEDISIKMEDLIYKSIILKVLNKSFKSDYIIDDVVYFKNRYTTLKSKISFSIINSKNSNYLIPLISDTINSYGLKIAPIEDKYHLNLYLDSSIIYTKTYGFILAKSLINITIKNFKNQIISTKQLHINAQAIQKKELAKVSIIYNLKNFIDKDSIIK